MLEIVSGWDIHQPLGYALSTFSAIRRTSQPLRFTPLMERALRYRGLYTRPHEIRDGKLWCPISDAPMSTPFAITRFLTPWLSDASWALFIDGTDCLWLDDPAKLFELADDRFAVQVVRREEYAQEAGTKMGGEAQVPYLRKGWSAVCLWNLSHPANARLTIDDVNTRPGRDLHAFYWLEDHEIGDLPIAWNFLAGVDPVGIEESGVKPSLLHFTEGTPELLGPGGPWSEAWLAELAIMESARAATL